MLGRILKNTEKLTGAIIGTVTGPIIGISVDIIASTLGITVEMVKEAKRAGCETYEEIKDFFNL